MSKLIILCGISGSGKSTYARQLCRESRGKVVRVNRDDIRQSIFGLEEDHTGYYASHDLRRKERLVTEIQNYIIFQALFSGFSVVLDNTNLKIKYIKESIQHWEKGNVNFGGVLIKVIDTPLETCIQRDKDRDRTVGEEIIRKQYSQLQNLLKNDEFIKLQEKYK